ncbi:flagellar filament capping protein FliD [uncultured Aquabacterium sp.]|uniref:flagellar filament capping protein FliD n=1 Tax=Aquabacterium sp. TaxID=1872578 RepID=UPI0025F491B6|nr:flagellar filament capping protein FliD [uncultured Aquabacterium sp.]
MATTSSISSLGVGSGLDAESIVTKLVALERQPIANLKTQASKIQTKISEYGKIQSALSSFKDAAAALATPTLWNTTTAASSDSSVASVSTGDGALAGTYSLSVSKLASVQSVVSNTSIRSTSTVGAGSLSIELGSWSSSTPPAFSAQTGKAAVRIDIASSDTLDDIRSKINSSGAGVSASIVQDGSGSRLVIQSRGTGAANGFRIQTTDSQPTTPGSPGLSMFAYDPESGSSGTTLTQTASDASATINGISVTSASNVLTNVLTGVTLTLNKTTGQNAINISVAQDKDAISKAVNTFATSFTALATLIKNDTKYDAGTKTGGVLQGEGTALSIQSQLRAILSGGTGSASSFKNLSSLGLEMSSAGTLTVNQTKLSSALNNTDEMKKAFAYASGATDAENGIAVRLRSLVGSFLDSNGALAIKTAGLNTTLKNNQNQQDRYDQRADLYEKRLRAQYTALDEKMAKISGTSNYVTQMINSLNSSK